MGIEKVIANLLRTARGDMDDARRPSGAEFDGHAANVELALAEAVAAFQVDLSKPNAPAGRAAPTRRAP